MTGGLKYLSQISRFLHGTQKSFSYVIDIVLRPQDPKAIGADTDNLSVLAKKMMNEKRKTNDGELKMKTDGKDDKTKREKEQELVKVLIHNEVKKTVEECTDILTKAYDKVIDRIFDEAFNNDERKQK